MTQMSGTEQIRSTIQGMAEAYVRRDLERFHSFFSEDVVAIFPDKPPIVGSTAWKAVLKELFKNTVVLELTSEPKSIQLSGDLAVEWHIESADYAMGETGETDRRYFTGFWVFRRDDGGIWQVTRYISSPNPGLEPDRTRAIHVANEFNT